MRIAVLVANSYDHDSRVRRSAAALHDAGHDVHVVCLGPGADVLDQADGPTIHRAGLTLAARLGRLRRGADADPTARSGGPGERATTLLRLAASPLLALQRLHVTRAFRRALREIRPEAVLTNDPETLPAATEAIAAGAHHVHDAHELTSDRADQFRWERWLDLARERRHIPRANAVITAAPRLAELLGQRHDREVRVVRNIPTPPVAHAPGVLDLRAALSVAPTHRLAVQPGAIAPGRGLTTLVRALVETPHVEVVLLGTAVRGMDQELRRLADEVGVAARLHLLPPVPSDALVPTLATADVGLVLIEAVSESFRWSLPNKLFECLAAELPVIASDLPEIRRVIERTGGRLVDPASVASVAEALQRPPDPPDQSQVPDAGTELSKLVHAVGSLSW